MRCIYIILVKLNKGIYLIIFTEDSYRFSPIRLLIFVQAYSNPGQRQATYLPTYHTLI